MKMEEIRFHYTECGLDDVYLVNGVRRIPTSRGEAVQIDDIPGLHKAIGLHITSTKKELSGKEIRFLRLELNQTQSSLSVILGIDSQSLARWERGESERVPPAADRLIRLIYREQIEGNPAICKPLQRIAELNEIIGDMAADIEFEDDPEEGWRTKIPELAAWR
jgi:DNA-binding transcriptional regulator YiaG